MTTIEDVAKEAGVSIATVSRVLNQQQTVRESTAKRVYDAIKKLRYEPNLMGRNLRKNESRHKKNRKKRPQGHQSKHHSFETGRKKSKHRL